MQPTAPLIASALRLMPDVRPPHFSCGAVYARSSAPRSTRAWAEHFPVRKHGWRLVGAAPHVLALQMGSAKAIHFPGWRTSFRGRPSRSSSSPASHCGGSCHAPTSRFSGLSRLGDSTSCWECVSSAGSFPMGILQTVGSGERLRITALSAVEQIPALTSACASLTTAWCAWRSARKDFPRRLRLRRTVRVTVGSHTYEGQLAPKDLKRVASLLASLGRWASGLTTACRADGASRRCSERLAQPKATDEAVPGEA